jgi:hypothetical protein
MIKSDRFLNLRELVEDPEERQVIHFDLVNVRTDIREHVILTGKLKFEFLVLLKQVLNNLIFFGLLLLNHQVVLH